MEKINEEKLIQIAPYMFRYPRWDDITYSLLNYGFSCGDGWYDILEALIRGIAALDTEKQVMVFQVKEKFGTLRFYINGGTGAIEELISKAEAKSATTCEVCGSEKARVKNKRGWMSTICDNCEADDGR